jgi:hypothetical protein|tara:strand:+ start:4913 stop:5560 length:648 start_codon:yes stop_codon:yes gene_type:complete
MNDQIGDNLTIDHVSHSIGGFGGHAFRRLTHISMFTIPLLYYQSGNEIASYVDLNSQQFVSLVCITILLIEAIRLKSGVVIIGQREYESTQISALAWGALSVSLVFLIVPEQNYDGLKSGMYGIPLIFGLTFVDPLMGEIKRQKKDIKMAIIAGLLCSYSIWLGCAFWLDTPLIISILLAPLTVLGELPQVRYIDDNATMILFPLAALMILLPFV